MIHSQEITRLGSIIQESAIMDISDTEYPRESDVPQQYEVIDAFKDHKKLVEAVQHNVSRMRGQKLDFHQSHRLVSALEALANSWSDPLDLTRITFIEWITPGICKSLQRRYQAMALMKV